MAEDTSEAHVAFDQLQIGFADAGADDTYQDLAVDWRGRGAIVENFDVVVEDNRAHQGRTYQESGSRNQHTGKNLIPPDSSCFLIPNVRRLLAWLRAPLKAG